MLPTPSQLECPTAAPDAGVRVEVAEAGRLHTDWRQVTDSGRTGPVELPMLIGIIRHPKGIVTVDAGLGQTTRERRWPTWPASMFQFDVPTWHTLAERVGRPLKVLLTHMHYDHVGGLFDLAGVDAWTTPEDHEAYGPGLPPNLRDSVRWHVLDLSHSPQQALGRPAMDAMGDGTVLWLSTPGHTPGSASVLVRAVDHAWLFIGDTAWTDGHLAGERRPSLVSMIVDADRTALEGSLTWARWIKKNCPDVQVVAGHEPRWMAAD